MNKYDEKYEIRFAKYEEIEEIMQFIDTYWKKDHILAKNRKFFEYEMVVDGKVNFVIAKDRKTEIIHGLNGFIIASKNNVKLDIWGSIWKVIPNSMGLLGLEITKRLEIYTNTRAFLCIGGNPKTTMPILQKARNYDDVSKMQHFYCLAKRENYYIAKISHYEPFVENQKYQVQFLRLKDIEELKKLYDFSYNVDAFPYKDIWYINHRYFEHPIYMYQVYGLVEDKKVKALFICREQEYNGTKILRIVDYIGKPKLFGGISKFLKEGLEKYEYIDLYCYGFDTSYVRQAGMIELQENDTNIIPNYFAPYVAENIDIWVGTPRGKAVFFKADGDQDRPN
ncbi:MAG: hypothetical protein OSJ62_06550 [Lachnospiraceae bacterium]|nr:hypothetical protein [Lachnospiraceae bacterium]